MRTKKRSEGGRRRKIPMPGWNQRKIKDVMEEMRRVEEVMRRERSEEERRGRIEEVRRGRIEEQRRERIEEVRKERFEEVRREEEGVDLLGRWRQSTEVVEEDTFSPSEQEPREKKKRVEEEESQDMFAPTQQQPRRRRKKRVEVAKVKEVEEEKSQDMFAPTQEGLSPGTTPVKEAEGMEENEQVDLDARRDSLESDDDEADGSMGLEEKGEVDLNARRVLPDSEEIEDLLNLDNSVFLRGNDRSRLGEEEEREAEELWEVSRPSLERLGCSPPCGHTWRPELATPPRGGGRGEEVRGVENTMGRGEVDVEEVEEEASGGWSLVTNNSMLSTQVLRRPAYRRPPTSSLLS